MSYKHSKQRDMILDAMEMSKTHMHAEEIVATIYAGGNVISLATVYRNLTILEDLKLVKKVGVIDGNAVYDKTSKLHYHFYCEKCKMLYDIHMPYQIELNDCIRHENNVGVVESHEITFKGVCLTCQNKEEII